MTIRDADRIRDKLEVSLDGRQVFFLFFGGAVVACLVFVLGVMVGKRLEGRERVARVASTSAAVDPLAALDELGADEKADAKGEELAFPSALASGDKGRQKPLGSADVIPPPRPLTPDGTAVVAATHKGGAGALKPPVSDDKPAIAATTTPPPPPAAPVAAPVAAPAPPPASPSLVAASVTKFTLQISSFQARSDADALVTKLAGSGYKPFVVMSDVPDKGVFFRVRVGEYGSRTDALTAKDEFEKKQHIIAYVTRI